MELNQNEETFQPKLSIFHLKSTIDHQHTHQSEKELINLLLSCIMPT